MDLLTQTQPNFENFTALDLILCFLLSLSLSMLSGYVYSKNRGSRLREMSVVYGGVGLSCVITMILMALSTSLFYALGLFAALSIIRFRTPVKDVHDTVHLFLCIGIGIAVGAGTIKIPILGTVFILTVQSIYYYFNSNDAEGFYLLRVKASRKLDVDGQIHNVLNVPSKSLEVNQIHGDTSSGFEYMFNLYPYKGFSANGLVEELTEIPDVEQVLIYSSEKSHGFI